LSELPSAYINLDSEPERRASTEKVLAELGIQGPVRVPGVVMPGEYWKGLAQAVGNALELMGTGPFVLFEDDIAIGSLLPTIDVPDDADAVFIGISNRGVRIGERIARPYSLEFMPVPGYPHLRRVFNAISGHGVVYVSQRYISEVKRAAAEAQLPEGFHYDVLTAPSHRTMNVYALAEPVVYQNDVTDKIAEFTTRITLP